MVHRQPAADQCEGCTFFNGQVRELSYLHSRDVTYATLCQGPYEESVRYRRLHGLGDALVLGARLAPRRCWPARPGQHIYLVCYLRYGDQVFETYWTNGRGVEAMDNSYSLLDMTVYGRQEIWEDSPDGWPEGRRSTASHCSAPKGGPSPSGRAWKPGDPTTSGPQSGRRRRGSVFRAFGRPTSRAGVAFAEHLEVTVFA